MTTRSGNSGCATRDSTNTKVVSNTTASASATIVTGCPHEWISEFEKP